MNRIPLAALYGRLSKEDLKKIKKGDDSESIKNQKLMLTEYAMRMGWQIYDFYIDEDISGIGEYRPEFERLIKDAERQEFDIVLCKSQSRFTRDMIQVEKIIHENFLEWGIRFIGLTDGADTAVAGNKKSRQINGLTNEWYVEDQSNNIKGVLKTKMEDGQFIGSFAPYGYEKDPNDKHKLIIDEEAASVVRLIYKLYLQGKGTHIIAQELSEKGIPKPTIYKQNKGYNFTVPNLGKFNLWGHTTINRILRNQVYIGTLIQGKETTVSYKNRKRINVDEDKWIVIENNHESIIDKKDFYNVQSLLDSKRRVLTKKKESHIFATKVKCAHCGGSMIRCTTRGKSYDDMTYAYLKCKNNTLSKGKICNHKNRISFEDLYKAVEEEFLELIEIYKSNSAAIDNTTNLIRRVDYASEINKLNLEFKKVDYKIKEKERAITNLYLDKSNGLVDDKMYSMISGTLLEEIKQLECSKKSMHQDIENLEVLENQKISADQLLKKYLESNKQLTHEIVVECIDYITISAVDEDGNREINIYWKL